MEKEYKKIISFLKNYQTHTNARGYVLGISGGFESSTIAINQCLSRIYLEGRGNNGESYLLPWIIAGNHTSIDSYEKRNQKGFLFTVGDEPTLSSGRLNQRL